MPQRPAVNDNAHAFNLTCADLESLVSRAVGKALDSRSTEPVLVSKQDLARQIGVSPSQIDRLRKQGLPSVKVGESVRFEPAKVVAWLEKSGTA